MFPHVDCKPPLFYQGFALVAIPAMVAAELAKPLGAVVTGDGAVPRAPAREASTNEDRNAYRREDDAQTSGQRRLTKPVSAFKASQPRTQLTL